MPNVGAPRSSALFPVEDALQVSTLRLRAVAMARAHGFERNALDRVDRAVTELATNIVRHAGTGHVILRAIGEHATGCVEILALDKGSGVADISRAMRDDGSTSSSERRGGLVGIKRQAHLFDIYSPVGCGTAVLAHVGAQTGHRSTCRCVGEDVGVVCVPLRGEEECGDSWAIDVSPGRLAVLLVDGLGHGPDAASAALAAIAVFRERVADSPEDMVSGMHQALTDTRGAALSVTVGDRTGRTARFCGVGNVEGRIVTADTKQQLIPQNGIVGHVMPPLRAADVPWPVGGHLIMHSDGISSRWRSAAYPGLLARHPALMAGVIFRDFAQARDDATVLVIRDALSATAA